MTKYYKFSSQSGGSILTVFTRKRLFLTSILSVTVILTASFIVNSSSIIAQGISTHHLKVGMFNCTLNHCWPCNIHISINKLKYVKEGLRVTFICHIMCLTNTQTSGCCYCSIMYTRLLMF